MEYAIFRFTLNVRNHRSQATVKAFKGDTAIKLIITLTDGGNTYKINNGCSATLTGTRADGEKLKHDCRIEGDTIIYLFDEETTGCTGLVNCEITLYGANGGALTAPKFTIDVDEKEVEGTEPISEYSAEAIATVMGAAAKEYAREAAENARGVNETVRQESYTEAKETADEAKGIAETANAKSDEAKGIAETANAKSDEALAVVGYANDKANEAITTANSAEAKSKTAAYEAVAAQTKANEAIAVVESVGLSYDNTTGHLIYSYTQGGVEKKKTVDLPLESVVVGIEEHKDDTNGKPYLILVLANDNKSEPIYLDDIFEGFVKTRAEANKLYGTDADKKDTVYPIDNEGATSKGSIVRRTYNNGGINVPLTPESREEAASKFYVDKFVPIEPYNDFVSGVPVIYSRDHNGDVVPLSYDDIVFWDGEELPFDPDDIDSKYGGCIVQRGIDGEIYVPLVPIADAQAASKKYVDNTVQNASAKLYKHRVELCSIYNEATWAEDPSFTFHINFYRLTATPVTSFDEIQGHELMLEKIKWFTLWDGPDANRTAIALSKYNGRLVVECVSAIHDYGYDAIVFDTTDVSFSPDQFTITDTVYEV